MPEKIWIFRNTGGENDKIPPVRNDENRENGDTICKK
jgi:hypothetical protein